MRLVILGVMIIELMYTPCNDIIKSNFEDLTIMAMSVTMMVTV